MTELTVALILAAAGVLFLIGQVLIVGQEATSYQQDEMADLRTAHAIRRMQLVHHLADLNHYRAELKEPAHER